MVSFEQCYYNIIIRIIVLCGIDSVPWNTPHIQYKYGNISMEYCWSHKALVWI